MDLNTYIRRYIDGMRNGERKTESGMMYSEGSIKNKVSFQSEFDKFQRAKGRKYDYDDIYMDFYNDFVDFFNRKDYSPNTTGKHIKSLKEIMAAALADGMHTNTQSSMRAFKILSSETDTVYLTRREITDIEGLELSVMRITGHKTEKEFLKYIRVGEEENAALVARSKFFG